jgi:ribosomal protein S27AE
MPLVELSDYEYADLIHRREIKAIRDEYHNRQQTCEHSFNYSGHSHNEDAFTCNKCGYTEFR